jgi:hypothetical protein
MVDKIKRLLNVHDAEKMMDPHKLGDESLVFQQRIEDWVNWSVRSFPKAPIFDFWKARSPTR